MKMRPGVLLPLLMASLLAAGCFRSMNSAGSSEYETLLSSIQVYTEADRVNLVLQVTNTEADAIVLDFASGQSFDFIVSDDDGEEIWRWSVDQMFTQAEREVVLAAGESVRYEAEWNPPAALRGNFVAVGRLVARNHRVEQATRFELR